MGSAGSAFCQPATILQNSMDALHFELALMAYEVEPSLPLPVASIAFAMRVLWHVNFCFQSSGMLFLLEQWYRISKEKEIILILLMNQKFIFIRV